jgi:hypothetical protein
MGIRRIEPADRLHSISRTEDTTMRLPVIRGIIDRRILANFRVDPQLLAACLPAPFRPQLVGGFGIAGICLIRIKAARPKFLPAMFGIGSENAAHRIAVEWDDGGTLRSGVYVPRRDSSSLMMSLAGGRLFPGVQHRADFEIRETENDFFVSMKSRDGAPDRGATFDGLELRCDEWAVEPMKVNAVQSSYFDNRNAFPEGAVTFDNALLMRNIHHEWHSRESVCCG